MADDEIPGTGDLMRPRHGSVIEIDWPLWASRLDDESLDRARRTRGHGVLSQVQSRFLDIDPAALSADDALDALAAVQEQVARLQAREVELLVRAAGATRVVRDVLVEDTDPATGAPIPDRDPRVLSFADEVVDEIACTLRRSVGVVQHQVAVARLLHGPLARTRAALAGGRITLAHASVLADQAARMQAAPLGVDPDADLVLAKACEQLQDRTLPWAGAETVAECRSRARRAITRIDPAGCADRRRRATLSCDVTGRAMDDGLALIEAVLPALDAARVLASVDAGARDAITSGAVAEFGLPLDATLGKVRAAVFARLMTSSTAARPPARTEATPRTRVEIAVLVDAATLAGLTPDEPVWVQAGSGHLVDAARADLIDLLAEPSVDPVFRRLVTDPATGALVDRGANAYAATAALRAWLAARDQRCTHPGCTRPARRCDVDHIREFADGGRTTIRNTHLLCRRHHNGKTHLGWRIENEAPDGSHDVVSPTGRVYRHFPVDLAGADPVRRRTPP